MTIVAEEFTHVIGVDTHAAKHAYAIVDAVTGGLVAERTFPTSQAGIAARSPGSGAAAAPGSRSPSRVPAPTGRS